MRVPIEAAENAKGQEVLRLLKVVRFAKHLAPLRMTVSLLLVLSVGAAHAATYYVSSSTGNDSNTGTASATPWQTIAHVNAQTFLPGDSILFKRGDVWNESLAPPSSGSSGNPITFDAYGTGAAPNLTGYYAVLPTSWVHVTGNAWKAPLSATYSTINFCLFGSIWGQKVAAATSNLTAQWDFYLANGFVYVYSVGSPAIYYNEAIVPLALSNVPVISINGKSWLTFQHFLVNWFDQYGVYVQGASDHLVFANMEADSMIPQGTQPLGFYVNESTPGPGDIKIYNAEAHLNYDGFRFDGAATAIALVNDKAYANRDGALVDNTGAVTYSYCHFYASSLAVAGSTDVEWTSGSGPITGAGNVPADTAPAVQVYQRYPAEVTLTVDDAGMTAGADTYYAGTVLPVADAAGVPVGAAITVGYPLAQTLVSEFQGWVNAGRDVTSHSMSHTYYTNTDALDIQYTGSGTAATLNISGKILTITVTGASDSVSYNLAQGQAQGTIKAVRLALQATGKFTATENPVCQGPYGTGCSAYTEAALLAQDLADVSGQDVKASVYAMQLDVTRLTTDEITLSRQWMTTNLTGLPATPVYVYPGGYETTAMQGIAASVPYTGARGALKEDLGVRDTYASGFNGQNVTSFGVNPSWMGLAPGSLNQKIQALVWKEQVWGVPWGIFWHMNELSNSDPVGGTEITNLIQDFKNSGATIQTNTGLVNWLQGGTQQAGTDGNYYYKLPATGMTLDFRPTKNSPVVDAGQNLGTAYALDINGVNQNSYGSGWEIGAHAYQGYAVYGGNGSGSHFTVGGTTGNGVAAQLPLNWVNNNEGNSAFAYELSLPGTWVTSPAPGCTFHAPYWSGAPTSSGLQSAINDSEACRTATGVGIALDIPPALYTSTNGLVIPQSSPVTATSFLVLRSTMDANLPIGQTVCSHGVQDNLATSIDIGLFNPDCAGDVMYYMLGVTPTSVIAGGNSYSFSSPPAVTVPFYPNSFLTKTLPSDVANHCLGNVVCGGASDIANGLAIVSNEFGGNIANNASSPMVITTRPTIQTGVTGHTLYYATAADPVYEFIGAGGVHVPTTAANNPVGVFFHVTNQAQFSAETSDQFLNIWDQSYDIDAMPGGRILSVYNFNGGSPATLAIPGPCSCTTTSCAAITVACQINIGEFAEYDYPFEDTYGINVSAGAYASMHSAPLGGVVRQSEWSSGTINHALILNAHCMNQFTPSVFPSFGTTSACVDGSHLHVSNGSMLWIDSGYNCAALPSWQQPFCIAMNAHGGFIVDSGGVGAGQGFYDSRIENGVAWSLAGLTQPAPIFTYLAGAGTTNGLACSGSPINKCTFPVFNMPGLLGHLHVLDPCVPESMAGQPGGCAANGGTMPSINFTLANGTTTNTAAYNDVANIFTVQCTAVNCIPIQTCSPVATGGQPPQCTSTAIGPDHWLIEDMEARMSAGNTGSNSLVAIQRVGVETSTSQLASHIHFRKIWAHGDWCDGCLSTGANSIASAIALGCIYCSVGDSQVSEILRPGAEGHALSMDFGSQTKIYHNWLEGGSIGLLCGGFTSTISIAGYIPCTDLQIGRNRFTWPLPWIGQMKLPSSNPSFSCSPGCQSLARKNAIEFKLGVRALLYGNIFENVDNSGGQSGVVGPQLNVRNNSASVESSGTQNYNAVIRDVTVQGNIFRNGCEGFTDGARSNPAVSDGGGVSLGMQNVSLSNNLWYNISNTNFGAGCVSTNATGWSITAPLFTWQATITENAAQTLATAAITCASSQTGNCPAGPPGPGFAQTDIQVGDLVSVYGCTAVTGFNTPANALFALPSTEKGTLALSGTTGLTVVFPNTSAAPNSVDNTGNCTISNAQGYPLNFQMTHNTIVTDGGFNNGSLSQGAHFAPNGLIQNNIILGTGWISSTSEGNHTENLMWDALNTFTADYNVFPTRTAASYTEYGNNSSFPDPFGCTGSGCTPPSTMYFPATPYCTGATPTSACVGFVGAMSASSMPLMLSDYHNYELMAGSTFKAGGTGQASDGSDQGPNVPGVDSMQTENLYLCGTACGSPGPYLDTYVGPIGGVAIGSPPLTAAVFSSYISLISSLLTNPNITAVAPLIPWNAIESNTTPGSYDWTTIDSELLTLSASGKRLRLIADLATEGGVNTGTPSYVFGASWAASSGSTNPQDMVVCANFTGDSGSPYGNAGFTSGGVWNSSDATYGSDLSGQPVSYEPPFKTAAKNFVGQFVQHFSSACATYSSDCSNAATLAARIDYVRFGFTAGGENHPLCWNYWPLPAGYTTFEGAYLDGTNSGGQTGYVDEMTKYVAGAMATYHPAWTVVFDTSDLGGTASHAFADHEAQISAAAGYGFGTCGLQIADVTSCPGPNCDSDWYSNFDLYPPVPHFLQTLTASCPDNSCQTGNLVSLLTFATQHGAEAFELYPCDLLLALEPSAYPGTGPQACSPVFSTALYSASYAAAVTQSNFGP